MYNSTVNITLLYTLVNPCVHSGTRGAVKTSQDDYLVHVFGLHYD